MRTHVLILLALVSGFLALNVNAAKVSPEYFIGLWSLEGKEKCNSKDLEYTEFFKDGTFKSGKLGKVEAVGFWRLYKDDGDINLHMITSLEFFGKDFADYEGQFTYLDMRALPISMTKDEFEGVASFGDDLERFKATRCK